MWIYLPSKCLGQKRLGYSNHFLNIVTTQGVLPNFFLSLLGKVPRTVFVCERTYFNKKLTFLTSELLLPKRENGRFGYTVWQFSHQLPICVKFQYNIYSNSCDWLEPLHIFLERNYWKCSVYRDYLCSYGQVLSQVNHEFYHDFVGCNDELQDQCSKLYRTRIQANHYQKHLWCFRNHFKHKDTDWVLQFLLD